MLVLSERFFLCCAIPAINRRTRTSITSPFLILEYDNIPPISLREISTESFQWEVQNFSDYRDGCLLASPSFVTADRLRWRGIWKDSSLFLQLQSAVNPVTARIR